MRFEPAWQREAAKILPGEYYVTRRDMVLTTVLGSCVAACLRDPKAQVGGMNHFLLPYPMGNDPFFSPFRYGVHAMEVMINEMIKLGADKKRLEAKVFGGGRVLPSLKNSRVGEENAEFILSYLAKENIPILGQDLGGPWARSVYYFPRTGKALVKRMEISEAPEEILQEKHLRARARAKPPEGEVELFIEEDKKRHGSP